jgi:hypothetical protein
MVDGGTLRKTEADFEKKEFIVELPGLNPNKCQKR